jgi:hypothetical protein
MCTNVLGSNVGRSVMMRECSHCHKQLTPEELAREESKGMEAERKALGLQGVCFLYYNCSDCGYADIFVDVHAVAGEMAETFRQRRQELESTVRQLHADRVEIVVTDR